MNKKKILLHCDQCPIREICKFTCERLAEEGRLECPLAKCFFDQVAESVGNVMSLEIETKLSLYTPWSKPGEVNKT